MTGQATENGRPSMRSILAPLLLVAAILAAYSGSFSNGFIFDDAVAIRDNPNIRRMLPIPVYSRMLVDVSFKLNYAIGGLNVADYHAVNIAIHIIAGLLLFGIVSRTLALPVFQNRYAGSARWIAAVVAALWAVHPLQTESVTYICQRYESMMGMFFLLTLYCFARAAAAPRPGFWLNACLVASVTGMMTKEVMVTAPLTVFLYDCFFAAGSAREAFRLRLRFHAFMLATSVICMLLLILWLRFVSITIDPRTVVVAGIPPLPYLLTQAGVILRYLRLSVAPWPLCLDYAWPPADGAREILPAIIAVGVLAVFTILAVVKRRPIGFLGACFFIILAPSSSILPLGDIAFEHRMYLPLAAVLIAAAMGAIAAFRLIGRRARGLSSVLMPAQIAAACCVILVFVGLTRARNAHYASASVMWREVVRVEPENLRAQTGMLSALIEESKFAEAEQAAASVLALMDSMAKKPKRRYWVKARSPEEYCARVHNEFGRAVMGQDRIEEAATHFSAAMRADPAYGPAACNLALVLSASGRYGEARVLLERLLPEHPSDPNLHLAMGLVSQRLADYGTALNHYRQAALSPHSDVKAAAQSRLALLLAECPLQEFRNGAEAVKLAKEACEATTWKSMPALEALAAAYAETGSHDLAVETIRLALKIAQNNESTDEVREQLESRLQSYLDVSSPRG